MHQIPLPSALDVPETFLNGHISHQCTAKGSHVAHFSSHIPLFRKKWEVRFSIQMA